MRAGWCRSGQASGGGLRHNAVASEIHPGCTLDGSSLKWQHHIPQCG